MASAKSTQSVQPKTPTVKAYDFGSKIVVKYYDDGRKETLSCPYCHWSGKIEKGDDVITAGFSEIHCPDCYTKLAMVSESGIAEPAVAAPTSRGRVN